MVVLPYEVDLPDCRGDLIYRFHDIPDPDLPDDHTEDPGIVWITTMLTDKVETMKVRLYLKEKKVAEAV